MENIIIKERWNQLKISRFSKLVIFGKQDEIDLFLTEKEFLNMETFVDDYLINYCGKQASSIKFGETLKDPSIIINKEANIIYIFIFIGAYGLIKQEDIDKLKSTYDINQVIVVSDISDIDHNFSSDTNVVNYSLKNVLEVMLVTDEIKNRYFAIEEKYKKKIDFLNSKTLKDFVSDNEYKEGFITYLAESVFKQQNVFSDSRITEKIIKFLMNNSRSDYVYLIYTCSYTNDVVEKLIRNQIETIDFSFAALTMFKLIEKLLYEICLSKYPYEIFKNDSKIVNMDERKMMLSDMAEFLMRKSFIDSELYKNLNAWIKYDRNGYAHKHIMNKESFDECVCNTYNLFFELVNLIED